MLRTMPDIIAPTTIDVAGVYQGAPTEGAPTEGAIIRVTATAIDTEVVAGSAAFDVCELKVDGHIDLLNAT
jgi:hypothetical protein